MNDRLLELMRQRGELQARIAAQRETMGLAVARWESPLQVVDKGVAMVRHVRRSPWVALVAVALLVWRRRNVASIARSGWKIWMGYRFLKRTAMRFSSGRGPS